VTAPGSKRKTSAQRAFERLREQIYSGRFRPGDALREKHLARELGVGQSTIREALLRLQNSGLVVRVPNACTRVTDLSPAEAEERRIVRLALEETAVRAALPRLEPQDFAALAGLVDGIAAAVEARSGFDLCSADLEFHRYLWRASGNTTLVRTLEQVTAPWFAAIGLVRSQSDGAGMEQAVHSHQRLVELLARGDPEEVIPAVREHVLVFRTRFFDLKTKADPAVV